MKKPLTIGLVLAASIAGALSLMTVDGGQRVPANIVTEAAAAEREPEPVVVRMAQLAPASPVYMLDYQRGPRIIRVPQAGERAGERVNDRASVRPVSRASVSREEPAFADEQDDEEAVEVAPQPPAPVAKPSSKKKIRVIPMQRQVSAPSPAPDKAPRWKMRTDVPPPPPPSGPKRAVLSAPPLGAEGPTPIRPTPRFESNANGAARFASPADPAPSQPDAEPPLPPLGYSPPATPEPPLGYSPPTTPLPED